MRVLAEVQRHQRAVVLLRLVIADSNVNHKNPLEAKIGCVHS